MENGRDIFTDVWFVARQAWYVRELTSRFAPHPAIAGWLLSNEIPIYGNWKQRGIGVFDHSVVASWAQILIDAVRAGGGTQPVSTGDGAWGVEVTGEDNGFRVRDLAPLVDFHGPHVYRMETDAVRQNLGAAFVCELLDIGGKPVVLEEFGVTSDYVSEPHAAAYYRQILHNTLLAGATGWLAWNNTDFDDLVTDEPYRHHPFVRVLRGQPREPRGQPVDALRDHSVSLRFPTPSEARVPPCARSGRRPAEGAAPRGVGRQRLELRARLRRC